MRWYEGSIADAVTLSKQKNAIFVVFVEGQNELSTEMAAALDGEPVLGRLSDPHRFLAVKLRSGTPNYTHFAQLYQLVPVPSLFFIGRNGTPLEVVCAGVEPSDLADRIDRILAQYHKDKEISQPLSVQPSTSFQQGKQESANLLQSETLGQEQSLPSVAKPEEKRSNEAAGFEDLGSASKIQKTEYEVVCDGDVCVRRAKSSDGAGPSQSSSLPSQVASVGQSASAADQAASAADQAASKPSQLQMMELEPTEKDSVPSVTSSAGCVEFPPSTEAVLAAIDDMAKAEASDVAAAASDAAAEADRVERAKELIEARKREKAEKEKELEKQRELERRSAGQGVAELKRWQAEQELKQIQEERKREKLENDLARQRILQQIALDRAERRAREEPAPGGGGGVVGGGGADAAGAAAPGDSGNGARISFKLPDGASHTVQFQAEQTLADLTAYVSDNLHMSPSSFSLWAAFPRRSLQGADRSLRDLQLAPSAAVLVQPGRGTAVAPAHAWTQLVVFVSQLFSSLIMEPMSQLYTWLSSRLLGTPPPPATAPRTSPAPDAPRGGPYRRKGTVHRLAGDKDNDDNNTWNGNSTQQM